MYIGCLSRTPSVVTRAKGKNRQDENRVGSCALFLLTYIKMSSPLLSVSFPCLLFPSVLFLLVRLMCFNCQECVVRGELLNFSTPPDEKQDNRRGKGRHPGVVFSIFFLPPLHSSCWLYSISLRFFTRQGGERVIDGKSDGADEIRVITNSDISKLALTTQSGTIFYHETHPLLEKQNYGVKERCPCPFPFFRYHSSRFFITKAPREGASFITSQSELEGYLGGVRIGGFFRLELDKTLLPKGPVLGQSSVLLVK